MPHRMCKRTHIWVSYTEILIYEHHIPANTHIRVNHIRARLHVYDHIRFRIWSSSLSSCVYHIRAQGTPRWCWYMRIFILIYESHIWLSYTSTTILYMRLTYEYYIYDTYMIIIYRGIQGSSCLHIIHIYMSYIWVITCMTHIWGTYMKLMETTCLHLTHIYMSYIWVLTCMTHIWGSYTKLMEI